MHSWMIVTAVGVFATGWMPVLPPLAVTVTGLLFTLCQLLRKPGRTWPCLFALGCGICYGQLWGSALLQQRLPAELEGELLQVQARVM